MEDESTSGHPSHVLAYKYKLPGLAFASYSDTVALSLHKKVCKLSGKKKQSSRQSIATLFVEACNLNTFTCLNPQVCTVEHKAWPAHSFWLKVIGCASLDTKSLSNWFSGSDTRQHAKDVLFIGVS